MPDLFIEACRLDAYEGAFVFAPRRRISVQPNALVWSAISRPGDEGTIVSSYLGRLNGVSRLIVESVSFDVVERDCAELRYFAKFGRLLESWLNPEIGFPQLIVGTRTDLRGLEALALRAGGVRDVLGSTDVPSQEFILARRFGLLLGLVVSAARRPGQQSVVIVSDLVSGHMATGLRNGSADHMLAVARAMKSSSSQDREAAELLSLQPTPSRMYGVLERSLVAAIGGNSLGGIRVACESILHSYDAALREIVSFVLENVQTECEHLGQYALAEERRSRRSRLWADKVRSEAPNVRRFLQGSVSSEERRVLEFTEADAALRDDRAIVLRYDLVARVQARLVETRELAWGIVSDSRVGGYVVTLAMTSGDPDLDTDYDSFVDCSTSGSVVQISSVADTKGHRLAYVMMSMTDLVPEVGSTIDFVKREGAPPPHIFRETAWRRFARKPWISNDVVRAPVARRPREVRSHMHVLRESI